MMIQLALVIAATVNGPVPMRAQAPAAAARPNFTGAWIPSDPTASDRWFDVGLTNIPGQGRVTIAQRPDRLTVTITMPDEKLDPLLTISGRFYPTVIYRLTDAPGRIGGAGAGGPLRPSVPTWFGDRLVIPDPWPSFRRTSATYSLDGDRLKLETSVEVDSARSNTITQWFTKAK
jgi:hypothetical protein